MKNLLILFTALLFISSSSFGQKRKVLSCANFIKWGEIKNAKKEIDEAITHEKTKDDAKTWYYYARTYHSINDSCMFKQMKDFCELEPNALDMAYDAYMKAWVLNFEDEEYRTLNVKDTVDQIKFFTKMADPETKYEDNQLLLKIMAGTAGLTNSYVNKGLQQYKEEKFDNATSSFERALLLSQFKSSIAQMQGEEPVLDTALLYYSALASRRAEQLEKAIQYYEQLAKMDYGNTIEKKVRNYYFLSDMYKKSGDTAKYMEAIAKGLEKYPKNGLILMNNMINHYLESGHTQKALDYLNKAIEKNPNNANYYTVKGSTYESMEENDSAAIAYKKALELNPEYTDALVNLGVMYYNKAADINEKMMDPNLDNEEYAKLKEERAAKFKEALPLLEKAYEQEPEDLKILVPLKTIYYRTKNMEKHDIIKAKIDELTGK